LYEYRCEACQQRFEVIRKFSDPELDACTRCGKGPVQRLQSSPAIQFKGSGWYITDYSQKGKAGTESTGTSATGDAKPTAAGDAAAGTKTPSTKTDTATPAGKPAASD
jgi:putative FmdB family regulatory protein